MLVDPVAAAAAAAAVACQTNECGLNWPASSFFSSAAAITLIISFRSWGST